MSLLHVVIVVVLGQLGCGSAAPAEPVMNSAPAEHVVHGVVRDYRNRVVPEARVSASFGGSHLDAVTDVHGTFALAVPRGAFVSASKADMLGHTIVDGEEIVIVMSQMPM